MKKGSGTVESSRRAGRVFLSQPVLFPIDSRPEFVRAGDSFPAAVVVVCGAGKAVFPAGNGFASIAFGSPNAFWENPNPLQSASGGDADEGGDLRQVQQRQSAGGKH